MTKAMFSDITEKCSVKDMHRHWTAKIRFAQHCAAISALSES